MWMGAFRVLMGIAVLGCIAASATFAFEFGWTRGATEVHRWTYALAAVALDLLKAGLPIFGAIAWHDHKPLRSDPGDSTIKWILRSICSIWRPRAIACWLTFTVLTGLSLWCAYGTTATQLAVKFADQAVAGTTQATRQGKLDRLLEDKRKQQPYTVTSEEALKEARESSKTATEQKTAECSRGKPGPLCRDREKDEREAKEAATKAAINRAATLAAEKLAADIEAAEKDLETVDVKTATMAADPQSDSMAKAIGADQNLIAALSHAFFAIAIEIGSGVGFWLVFGHGAPNTPREEAQVSPPSTALVPIDRNGAVELQVIDEKPEEIIERFFLEVARSRLNGRVQSIAVWSAYKQWCADRNLDPVSHAMFGRLARWRKDRIGGTVWYLDCELAEGYAELAPAREPKALPRLSTAVRGTPTAH